MCDPTASVPTGERFHPAWSKMGDLDGGDAGGASTPLNGGWISPLICSESLKKSSSSKVESAIVSKRYDKLLAPVSSGLIVRGLVELVDSRAKDMNVFVAVGTFTFETLSSTVVLVALQLFVIE